MNSIVSAPRNKVVLTECGIARYVDQRSFGSPVESGWYLCHANGEIPTCAEAGSQISAISPEHWVEFIPSELVPPKKAEHFLANIKGVLNVYDGESAEMLPPDWTGFCTSSSDAKAFWYIGRDQGERSFTRLQGDTIEKAKDHYIRQVAHESMVLTEAIVRAGVKSGLATQGSAFVGPDLVLLCDDMASALAAQAKLASPVNASDTAKYSDTSMRFGHAKGSVYCYPEGGTVSDGFLWVASTEPELVGYDEDQEKRDAMAARLTACANACRGMVNPEVAIQGFRQIGSSAAPALVAATSPLDSSIRTMGGQFVERLKQVLSATEFAEICLRNSIETDRDVCHSHDIVDANVLMAEAFESVVGVEMDGQYELHAAIWNAAWEHAFELMVDHVQNPPRDASPASESNLSLG